MTRYILVGGYDWKAADRGKALVAEMLRGIKKPAKMLLVLFARPREDWEKKFITEKQKYAAVGANVQIELAHPDAFVEQVARNDIIVLKGGDEALLDYYLARHDLAKLFKAKTVVGSSAGADYIAAAFWTCDWRAPGSGRALVRAAIIPHYQSEYGNDDPRGPIDWKAARTELEEHVKGLPIHALHEGEFVSIEV